MACDRSDRDAVQAVSDRIGGEWSGELALYPNAGVTVPLDIVDSTPWQLRLQPDVTLSTVMDFAGATARPQRGTAHRRT